MELIRNRLRITNTKEAKMLFLYSFFGILIGLFPLWDLTLSLVVGTGILTIVILMIARMRYEYIVFFHVILLSIVLVDPSPSEILFLLLLFFGLINGELKIERIKEQSLFFALFSGFVIVNLIGLLNMIETYRGIRYLVITFYLLSLGTFFFLYLDNKKSIYVLRAYVISTILSAFLGFLGYFGYFSQVLMYDEYRIQALFKDPNVFGPFLVPSVIILLADLKERKILGNHFIGYILSITLVALGAIFSFSRAAWINLIVSIGTYYLLNIKKIPLKKIMIVLFLVFLCIYFTWSYILEDSVREFFNIRSSLQGYDVNRYTSQKIGLSLATDNFFGYGPGQYEVAVVENMGVEFSAHNLYIRVILENGIIGFVFFMTAIGYILVRLFQVYRSREGEVGIKSSVMISILVGIMINSLAIDTLHWRHLWFFIGISLSLVNEGKSLRLRKERGLL